MSIVVELLQQALLLAVYLSALPLLASLIMGFVVSVLQAATQIHDQTLSFVPKVFAVSAVLILAGTWMVDCLCDFFAKTMSAMAIL